MKICVISTTVMTVPVRGYGGLEVVAYQCAEGLARRGHDVTLVAPVGSVPPPGVELHGTTLGESEQQAYSGYWQRLPSFDVIIDHSWQKWAYILKCENRLHAPILGVCHAPIVTMYNVAPPIKQPCLVAISQDQADAITGHLSVPARVCYNAVDTNFYKSVRGQRSERYLFLGRISTIKGPHIAVDVARRCRVGLDIVGDDKLTGEPQLAQRVHMIAADSHGQIVYHGPKQREDVPVYFSGAKALLHMNQHFREPFGLAPVEAQACGAPVIAWDNGAMRETIVHGETGFLVKSQAEVEELVKTDAVASIKPEACRASAERFSLKRMVDTYEKLCAEALEMPW